MKNRILKISAFILITLSLLSGCLFNTKEDWDKLPDRKFCLSEFHFVLLAQSKEEAFEFFRKFPVKKLMFILAKEYNIKVDISEFNNFIITKNLSEIEAKGLLRTVENSWKKSSAGNNKITLIFEQDYLDESTKKLKIGVYRGNSTLKIIQLEMNKIDSIFKQLNIYLPSSKESLVEYEEKNYDKISPIPLIIESNNSFPVVEEPDGPVKIKTMIDNYVKTLDKKERDNFKHDIIDYIYQKCN